MFARKERKNTTGLKEVMLATTNIMSSSKWKDESLEGLLLQVSLLKQIIDSFQKTEKDLSSMLGNKITSANTN